MSPGPHWYEYEDNEGRHTWWDVIMAVVFLAGLGFYVVTLSVRGWIEQLRQWFNH